MTNEEKTEHIKGLIGKAEEKVVDRIQAVLIERLDDTIQKQVNNSVRTRFGLLEGMCKVYLDRMSLKPTDIVLVEQTVPGGKIFWYFTEKRNVTEGMMRDTYGRSEDRTVAGRGQEEGQEARSPVHHERRDGYVEGGQL